jgi:hypothetical protein
MLYVYSLSKEQRVSELEIKHQEILERIKTTDQKINLFKKQAHDEAHRWYTFRKDPKNAGITFEYCDSDPILIEEIISSIYLCYQKVHEFLHFYVHKNDPQENMIKISPRELLTACKQNHLLDSTEKRKLQVFFVKIFSLCDTRDEKGVRYVDIDLIDGYDLMCSVIKRINVDFFNT